MTQLIDPSLWAEARLAYSTGSTADEVCARFGLGRSAFYARAASEGWRRADLAPRTSEDIDDEETPEQVRPAVDLAEDAMARATRAIGRGRLREARGWTKLAAELRQMAIQDFDCQAWKATVADACAQEAWLQARLAQPLPSDMDRPDASPAEFSAPTSCADLEIGDAPDSVDYFEKSPPAPPPLNRAARRALGKRRAPTKLEMARRISGLAP